LSGVGIFSGLLSGGLLSGIPEGLLPGSVATCDVDVLGGASSPSEARETT